RLQVAAADNAAAPRGVLLLLTGGPGQPGVPFVSRLAAPPAPVLHAYPPGMFGHRGTRPPGAVHSPPRPGPGGCSEVAVPPAAAVHACAHVIGPDRQFYSTRDTVADIDMLRAALGVPTMVVDGVSYGTFVAERYALAYSRHVSRLVLDSILPQAD